MLKERHELISRGPYARIRHPIYTGVDLAFLGTALAVAEWRGMVAFVLAVAMLYQKARTEEAWLARDFGVAFEAYLAPHGHVSAANDFSRRARKSAIVNQHFVCAKFASETCPEGNDLGQVRCPQNQIESKPAIETPAIESEAIATPAPAAPALAAPAPEHAPRSHGIV